VVVWVFPERLKYSEVKPLYKKGEKSCKSNYRSISLLSRIWGSHGGEYEDGCLLGCSAV
jgi:hypothetical protein